MLEGGCPAFTEGLFGVVHRRRVLRQSSTVRAWEGHRCPRREGGRCASPVPQRRLGPAGVCTVLGRCCGALHLTLSWSPELPVSDCALVVQGKTSRFLRGDAGARPARRSVLRISPSNTRGGGIRCVGRAARREWYATVSLPGCRAAGLPGTEIRDLPLTQRSPSLTTNRTRRPTSLAHEEPITHPGSLAGGAICVTAEDSVADVPAATDPVCRSPFGSTGGGRPSPRPPRHPPRGPAACAQRF